MFYTANFIHYTDRFRVHPPFSALHDTAILSKVASQTRADQNEVPQTAITLTLLHSRALNRVLEVWSEYYLQHFMLLRHSKKPGPDFHNEESVPA